MGQAALYISLFVSVAPNRFLPIQLINIVMGDMEIKICQSLLKPSSVFIKAKREVNSQHISECSHYCSNLKHIGLVCQGLENMFETRHGVKSMSLQQSMLFCTLSKTKTKPMPHFSTWSFFLLF